jgi:predicted AlkP superfamily pyrophosphatase or phosphodiesterase
MTVTPLRPNLNTDERAFFVMLMLANVRDELAAIKQQDPDALAVYLKELDEVGHDFSRLSHGLRMTRSLVHLTSAMGRAP